MMKRTPRQAVEDVLATIKEIRTIIGKKNLTTAFDNITTRRAIERCLQILTEAAGHLPVSLTRHHPNIDWRAIKDAGNFLRHEYANVSPPILTAVIQNHLTPLSKVCQQIQKQLAKSATD